MGTSSDKPLSGSLQLAGSEQGARHTPGPWFVDENPEWYPWPETYSIVAARGDIAWMTSTASQHDRDLADARLMAAAPDLLAALEKLTTDIATDQRLMDHISLSAFEEACDAIAKATEARVTAPSSQSNEEDV